MPSTAVKGSVAGTESTEQLLIRCLRAFMASEGSQGPMALLNEDVDWPSLLRSASWHRVVPLLYRGLSTTCPDAVPKQVLNQLEELFHANLRRNLLLTAELLKVLHLLGVHGIPVIPFKGPALASYLYGNLALRQFVDLDILVRKQDVLKAKELLLSQGYKPLIRMNHRQEVAYLRSQIEYNFYHQELRVCVEVHWWIDWPDSSMPLDLDGLWGRLEAISVGGRTVLHLAAEELALVLCLHGSRHLWHRLNWICDVAQLVRIHQDMDWSRVMERATTPAARRKLLLGLFLAKDLLAASLPEEAWQKVQHDPAIARLAEQVMGQLLKMPHAPPGFLERMPFEAKMRDRLRDRVGYCVLELLRATMIPKLSDRERIPLPEFLSPLYYILRPMRLAAKYTLMSVSYIYNRCKER